MVHDEKYLKLNGKIIFWKFPMDQFKRIPKLFHEDESCFMFIDSGGFQVRTPDTIITFSSGDAMLAKCTNYYFENSYQTAETDKLNFIGAYFYPSIIKNLFRSDLTLSSFQTNYTVKKVNLDKLLLNYKENISILLDNPHLATDELITLKLKELLLLLSKTENASSLHDFISSLFKPQEYNFSTIIEKNIFSDLSLEEYAHLCNMSLSSFKRMFYQIYNDTPAHYFKLQKLKRAADLLITTEQRIGDIAFDCGFSDVAHFSKSFLQKYKTSPSNYRQNNNSISLK